MQYSFIIPVYNSIQRLEMCINSILLINDYGCSDFEIILVDDGSTNISANRLDELALGLANILVIHNHNGGVSAARNTGIKFVQGEFIVFIDSDDIIISDRLAECLSIMRNNTSIDMLFFGISFDYYTKRNTIYRSDEMLPPYNGTKTIYECMGDIDLLYDRNCLSPIWNKIIRKRVLDGLWFCEDMFLLEDLEYSLRLLSKSNYVFFYRKVVYLYYQAGNSSNRIKRIKHVNEITDKIDNALNYLSCDKKYIVSCVNNWLIQEKIKSMSLSEVKEYYPNEYFKQLFGRPYWRLRHSVANWIKQHFGDFRKW